MANTCKRGQWHQYFASWTEHILFLGAVLAIGPSQVLGLGFRIPNQDAEATARGNAFIATADNPSAIYYNPAGITQLQGHNAQVGGHVITVRSHFEPAGGGKDENTKSEIQMAPQLYYAYAPADCDFAFGLGVYAPYGLGLEWSDDVAFRDEGIEGRLLYSTISPVVAWRITPTFSLAAGPTLDYAKVDFRQGFGGIPNSRFHFRGDGIAFGAKAGLLWQPHPKWSFGASYFSPTTIDFEGDSSASPVSSKKQDTSSELDFPQFIMGGISYRPTTNWNVEVGIDWTDWDTLNTVIFKGTAFGNVPLPLNWESSVLVHFGASRYLRKGYWIAAGYFFSQNSTSERDFSPIVPDTDLHVASVGVGRKGQRWTWAFSTQFITGPFREISNGKTSDGSYQFFNKAINFSMNRHF